MATPARVEIGREEWDELRPRGERVETRTTVMGTGVDIEDYDGWVSISASAHEDGVDVRVGDLELFVQKQHVALVQRRGPYPITRWAVLFDGEMAS